MRVTTRISAVAASAALGIATVLGGAGVASAAPYERVVDGPSMLAVELDGAGELVLSYDNQSGQDLTCITFVSTEEVAAGLFEHFAFEEPGAPLPDYLIEMQEEAQDAKLGAATLFVVPAEGSGPVGADFLTEYDFSEEWPVATARCLGVDYEEVELSAPYPPGSEGVAILDSPSVLTVTGRGTGTTVSYQNNSGRGLMCVALVGDPVLIGEMYALIENDPTSSGELDEELRVALENATRAGAVGTYGGGIGNGESMELPATTENIEPAGILTDDSFDPVGVSFCSLYAGENTYTEVEISEASLDDGDDEEPIETLPAPILDSPSVLTILPSSLLVGGFPYSYDNRSGEDLYCTAFLGSQEYVDAQLSRIDKEGLVATDVAWLPSSAEGVQAGWFVSRAGTSGPVSTLSVPGPETTETEPHAVSFCLAVELDGNVLVGITGDYFEIETAMFVADDSDDDDDDDDDNDNDNDEPPTANIIEQIIDAIDVFGSLN